MAAVSWVKLFPSVKLLQITTPWNLQSCANFAKALGVGVGSKKAGKLGKLGPVVEKKVLPVETDPEKLVNFVCGSNYSKQGQDIQLKPDNEYPDWLWSLRLDKPPPLEEMDQNTLQYWRRLRKINLRRKTRLMALRRF
uniref:Large ribosomal subunit protein mL54 n=1 Tax=Scapholeberis mucronata TaxID=202097 RepID=A0A4Y7NN58_9CRUS|nr:EOG090X0KWJ [Scapholeberis mucronata]SVE94024.1 EOG090X0KWJ [Scapholeberis mucronata]